MRRALRRLGQFARVVTIFAISTVTVPIVVVGTVVGALIFLPLPAALLTPKLTLASRPSVVFDANGNEIATFSEFEQQIPVNPSDVPLLLKQALVASEDRNFYHHGGVDPRGTLRAIIRDLQGKPLQGGSTIAQQYVKIAFTGSKRTITRKLKEAILASQLERQKSKDDILFQYLNAVYFGDGAYGVGAAAETYFHVNVRDLDASQAAMLIGLLPAPSAFEPRANQSVAEDRRQLVLREMFQQKYLTQKQYDDALVEHLASPAKQPPLGTPLTLVYPPVQQKVAFPYFVDYVRRYLELDPRIGPSLLYRGGLQIQTTIDPAVEKAAETAVNNTLNGTKEPTEMSLVSIDPRSGFVKAMIGGRDFSADQTNLALGGCEPIPANATVVVQATCKDGNTPEGGGSGRQPGSAFKPFTLAAAFERGVQPSEVFAAPTCYTPPGASGKANTICNAESSPATSLTLRNATWYSINTVYAQLILDPRVGVQRVADMAKRLGITSAWYSPQVHGASYTLGALGVSPLDMASAYGVFDNHGLRVPPTPVALVEDPTRKVLIDNRTPAGQQVIDPAIADNVTDVLRGVITTGTAAGNDIGRPAAGKTGTTTNYDDAWFVGYVPTLSTAVWLGNKDRESHSLSGMKGVHAIFGATFSAPTWAAFMRQALANVPATDFSQPAPLQPVTDQLDRKARNGIDPGGQRYPVDVGIGGPYQYAPPPPVAVAPTTTTTTTRPVETTTTVPGTPGGGPGTTLVPPFGGPSP